MVRFCVGSIEPPTKGCNNLLTEDTSGNQLVFICKTDNGGCGLKYSGTAEDTFLGGENVEASQESIDNFRKLLQKASYWPSVPTEKKDCPKCGAHYVKYARLGRDLKKYHSCLCGNIF